MNENKIAFIYCVNNEELFEESVRYVRSLNVPEKIEVEIIPIRGAASICAGYNEGMRQTDAKYKIYIKENVYLVNKDFLFEILQTFIDNNKIGMLGIIGSKDIPFNGELLHSEERIGSVYTNYNGEMLLEDFDKSDTESRIVRLIDSTLMATQFDVNWREDLLYGSKFIGISQSLEFSQIGYHLAVPKFKETVCVIENSYKNSCNYLNEDNLNILENYNLSKLPDVQPIISICIPTYNRAGDLDKCLLSIFSEIGNDSRYEVIISDNNSSDSTQEIVERYLSEFSNLNYYRNKTNEGAEKNFIRAVQRATGKFIKLHGDDDFFVKDSLSKILKVVQQNSECGIVFLNVLNNNHNIQRFHGLNEYNLQTSADSIFMSSLIFKRDEFLKIRSPYKNVGTLINHVYWQYQIIVQNPKFCVFNIAAFTYANNLSGGYNYPEIHVKNYLDCLYFNRKRGLSEDVLSYDKLKTVNKALNWCIYFINNGIKSYYLDSFGEIIDNYYQNEPFYEDVKRDVIKLVTEAKVKGLLKT